MYKRQEVKCAHYVLRKSVCGFNSYRDPKDRQMPNDWDKTANLLRSLNYSTKKQSFVKIQFSMEFCTSRLQYVDKAVAGELRVSHPRVATVTVRPCNKRLSTDNKTNSRCINIHENVLVSEIPIWLHPVSSYHRRGIEYSVSAPRPLQQDTPNNLSLIHI